MASTNRRWGLNQMPENINGGASASRTGASPSDCPLQSFPLAVKKSDRPSGAQNIVCAPSVPGILRGSSDLKSRRNRLNAPLESMAVKASFEPSGDRESDCRLAAPSKANPAGG